MLLISVFLVAFVLCKGPPLNKFSYADYTAPTQGLKLEGGKTYKYYVLGKCIVGDGGEKSEKYEMIGNDLVFCAYNESTCTHETMCSRNDMGENSPQIGKYAPTGRIDQMAGAKIISLTSTDIGPYLAADTWSSFIFSDGNKCKTDDYTDVISVQISVLKNTLMNVCFATEYANVDLEYFNGQTSPHTKDFNITYYKLITDASGNLNMTTFWAPPDYSASSCVAENAHGIMGPGSPPVMELKKCDPNNRFLGIAQTILGNDQSNLADVPAGILLEYEDDTYFFNKLAGTTPSTNVSSEYEEECNILIHDTDAGKGSLARCGITEDKCDFTSCDYAKAGGGPGGFMATFTPAVGDQKIDFEDESYLSCDWNSKDEKPDFNKAASIQLVRYPFKGCIVVHPGKYSSELQYKKYYCNDTANSDGVYPLIEQEYNEAGCLTEKGTASEHWSLFCAKDIQYSFRTSICATNCDACTTRTNCTDCSDGYYLDGGACSACDTGCSDCDASVCTECFDGYYLEGGACQTCPTGCKTCSRSTLCQTCDDGYELYNGDCRKNALEGKAVSVILSFVVLLVFVFV